MTSYVAQKSRLFRILLLMIVAGLSGASSYGQSRIGAPGPVSAPASKLRFRPDNTFKIVQFTDTQDNQNTDPRTIRLIETVLDDQRPDLVVFTGDNIARHGSTPPTSANVAAAIRNIVTPVDRRGIPWLVTFGNHDEDMGMPEEEMLEIYRSYPYNINEPSPKDVAGSGNMNALIYSSMGLKPVFNVWALDSGRYAPGKIDGQTISEDFLPGWNWMPDWDWIKPSQIEWYRATSESIEHSNGYKVPSLMFFHIPLQEFRTMYDNDAIKRLHPETGLNPQHGVTGERNEDECPGPFNSGLFSAMLERGDVKGVFVGHDHVNDYFGNYFGIYLGYSANTGFGTYGLGGAENNRLRGARVFELNENTPEQFKTHMVFAKDYGIR